MLFILSPDQLCSSPLLLCNICSDLRNCNATKQKFLMNFIYQMSDHMMVPYRRFLYFVSLPVHSFFSVAWFQTQFVASSTWCCTHVLSWKVCTDGHIFYFVYKRSVAVVRISVLDISPWISGILWVILNKNNSFETLPWELTLNCRLLSNVVSNTSCFRKSSQLWMFIITFVDYMDYLHGWFCFKI